MTMTSLTTTALVAIPMTLKTQTTAPQPLMAMIQIKAPTASLKSGRTLQREVGKKLPWWG